MESCGRVTQIIDWLELAKGMVEREWTASDDDSWLTSLVNLTEARADLLEAMADGCLISLQACKTVSEMLEQIFRQLALSEIEREARRYLH